MSKEAEFGLDMIEQTRARVVHSTMIDEVSLGWRQASFDPVLNARMEIVIPKMEIPNEIFESKWVEWHNLLQAIRRNSEWSREQVDYMVDTMLTELPKFKCMAEGLRIVLARGFGEINYRFASSESWTVTETTDGWSVEPETLSTQDIKEGNGSPFAGTQADDMCGLIARESIANVMATPVIALLSGQIHEVAGRLKNGTAGGKLLAQFRELLVNRVKSNQGEVQEMLSTEGKQIMALGRLPELLHHYTERWSTWCTANESKNAHIWNGIDSERVDKAEGIMLMDPGILSPASQGSMILHLRTLLHDLKTISGIQKHSYVFYEGSAPYEGSFLEWNRELERTIRLINVMQFMIEKLLDLWPVRFGHTGMGLTVDGKNGRWRLAGDLNNHPIYHAVTYSSLYGADGLSLPTTYPVQVGEPADPGAKRLLLRSQPVDATVAWKNLDSDDASDYALTTAHPERNCMLLDFMWTGMDDESIDEILRAIERSTANTAATINFRKLPRGLGAEEAELLLVNDMVIRPRMQMFDLRHQQTFKFAPQYTEGRIRDGNILLTDDARDRWGYDKDERPVPTKVGYPRVLG